MPSSELKVSRLFSTKCHFGGNELVYKVYVGETGRNLGVRVGEHKKEVDAKDTSRFTRQSKKSAEQQLIL